MDNLDPPCRLEEVINFSFQFKNLQKYLDFLNNTDNAMNGQIKDLQMKIDEIEMLKAKLDDFEFKMNSSMKKVTDMESTISSHVSKFQDIESKMWVISSKNEDNVIRIASLNEKTIALEENTNNLNRLTEENIKNCSKLNENLDKLKLHHDVTVEKTEGCVKSINKLNDNVTDTDKLLQSLKTNYEAHTESIERKFEENKLYIDDNLEKLTRKYTDTNDTLIKIIDSVTELSTGVSKNPRRNSNNILNTLISAQSDSVNGNFNVEVGKLWREIEEGKNSYKLYGQAITDMMKKNEEMENEIKELNNKIHNNINDFSIDKEERLNTDFFNNTLNQFTAGNKNVAADKDMIHSILPAMNTEALNENMQKLSDNIKIVSSNLGHKANREDLDKHHKHFKSELERLSESLSDKIKLIEFKLKTSAMTSNIGINIPTGGSDNADMSNIGLKIHEAVERISMEVIEQQILKINLTDNKQFKEITSKVEVYKQEIDKLYESIIEMRSSMAVDKTAALEDDMKKALKKLHDIDVHFKKFKSQIEEISKNLEGEGEEAGNSNNSKPSDMKHSFDQTGLSIRDQVKQIGSTVKSLTDKLEKVTTKVEGMNAEILGKLRKDLQHESNRILEDFKLDLKSSINKIEEQLREKVDRFNLDEFGRRIDSKLYTEMNKKLDRNDLKRNNNLINRKIDTLENKISKTLVDTLIDLQMEEAPLIVKKSMNGEKCASCNQYLAGGNHNHHDNNNNHHDNNKTHFKGSKYSTVYRPSESKYHTNPINETLEENWKKNQLPDINTNKSNEFGSTLYKKKAVNTGLKFNPSQSVYIKHDRSEEPFSDKNLNLMINEELEKKYINPTDIIKSVNKAHESNERKGQHINK